MCVRACVREWRWEDGRSIETWGQKKTKLSQRETKLDKGWRRVHKEPSSTPEEVEGWFDEAYNAMAATHLLPAIITVHGDVCVTQKVKGPDLGKSESHVKRSTVRVRIQKQGQNFTQVQGSCVCCS